MVLTASMLIVAAVGVAQPAPVAEFYVVTQECSTTVASLEPGRRLLVRPDDAPDVKRCSRDGQRILCHAQIQVGERLVDDPAQLEANGYDLLPYEGPAPQARSHVGASWMTLNTIRRTVVTGVMGFSPAQDDPDSLDAVASWVCRGVLATSREVGELRKRK